MKNNSSAKKRFKITASGKIMRSHAFKNHILTKKSKKRKERLSKWTTLDASNKAAVKVMLPYAI